MDLELAGRKALVTGGTRGVGRGIVRSLARAGVNVITCYRSDSGPAAALERELKETGGTHHVMRADLTDPAQVDDLLGEARTRYGRLDLVVNNAVTVIQGPFAEFTLADWRRLVDTNVTAVLLVIQQALPLLSDGASVVTLSSKSVELGIPRMAPYTATKGALSGLNRSLAREFGPRRIRFNLLALGIIATEALDQLPPDRADALRRKYIQGTALGRLGTPDDVAGAVLWLASDLSRYVTGATIAVDGATG